MQKIERIQDATEPIAYLQDTSRHPETDVNCSKINLSTTSEISHISLTKCSSYHAKDVISYVYLVQKIIPRRSTYFMRLLLKCIHSKLFPTEI
jgi:hypothetical protein